MTAAPAAMYRRRPRRAMPRGCPNRRGPRTRGRRPGLTGAPCRAAAESPTSMKRTFRSSRAPRKQSSPSLSGGAATGQTPSQALDRRLFEQDQRMPYVVGVGLGMLFEDCLNGFHELRGPASGFAFGLIDRLGTHLYSHKSSVSVPADRSGGSSHVCYDDRR